MNLHCSVLLQNIIAGLEVFELSARMMTRKSTGESLVASLSGGSVTGLHPLALNHLLSHQSIPS